MSPQDDVNRHCTLATAAGLPQSNFSVDSAIAQENPAGDDVPLQQ
jgi:hypothetical protein